MPRDGLEKVQGDSDVRSGKPVEISIVIPTKNRPKELAESLRSLDQPSSVAKEVIVVDDGSDPPLIHEALKLSSFPLFILRNEGTPGAPAARNLGLARARGEYIFFLDDDDEILPGSLDALLEKLRESEADAVYGGYLRRYASGGRGDCTVFPEAGDDMVRELLASPQCAKAVLVRTDAVRNVGGFDESLPSCQDWDLHLRLSRQIRYAGLKQTVLIYAIHSGSISQSLSRRLDGQGRFLCKHEGLFLAHPNIYRSHLTYLGLLALSLGNVLTAQKWLCLAREHASFLSTATLYRILAAFPAFVSRRLALGLLRASGSVEN
ncbi:MAG TPA: glycosyltransferase [Thermoanaerobaculia bacterium]|nr:glycosyltransferase [Thermoanaerobaculia bacterium]HUM29398.1 glycosyltransferase [Thermoanaerobaculia bacterium]HXK67644.1 glycosyltransferase [Thermoanaerobaculia bacterium]